MSPIDMRNLLELSQEELAVKLDLDRATVIAYEADNPPAWYVWALKGLLAERFALQVAPIL